jgi:hypothetical protein
VLAQGGDPLEPRRRLSVILSETPGSYSFSLISIRYLRRQCSVGQGSRASEAGIAWRVSPQDVDDIGVVQPPQARP